MYKWKEERPSKTFAIVSLIIALELWRCLENRWEVGLLYLFLDSEKVRLPRSCVKKPLVRRGDTNVLRCRKA
jgi:hypothetical protein